MRYAISLLLFSLALLLEAMGLYGFLSDASSWGKCLLLHTISAVFAGIAVALVVFVRYPQKRMVWVFTLLIWAMPVVGLLGALLAIIPALFWPKFQPKQRWQATAIPSLPFKAREEFKSPLFHDGGLSDVMRYSLDPEQRLWALMATRSIPGDKAIPILQLALRDPVDDVRLLAYSMLDRFESELNQNIEKHLGALKRKEGDENFHHEVLALAYWELAYLGLAQGGVKLHALNQTLVHLKADTRFASSAESLILAARVSMEQEAYAQAASYLNKARAAGASVERLLLWRAELAFMQRDYASVSELLTELPKSSAQRAPFVDLVRFWQ